MSTRRKAYWLVDQITPDHKARALMLHQKGFDIQFFSSFDALLFELQAKRASIIVISDDGDARIIEKAITALIAQPEVQGARMIMTCRHNNQRLEYLAATAGFRDLIPMNIGEREWLQRFIFATASRPLKVVQPTGQITAREIAAIHLPARVTWLSEKEIRLESRVQPPRGAVLTVSGPLAEILGVPSLTLTIKETQRDFLTYRFSDAIVCEWHVPEQSQSVLQGLLNRLKAASHGPKARIFIAAQNPDLRNNLLSRFEDPRYSVTAALQKHAIAHEPKYFSPQLVLIEDALCIGENRERFEEMLTGLSSDIPVIMIGETKELEPIKKKFPMRKLIALPRVPRNFQQAIIKRYLAEGLSRGAPADAIHLDHENPLSLAEIGFGVRLVRIHPRVVQIAMPFHVGDFALCRLDSPWMYRIIGRNPFVKFTKTYRMTHPGSAPYLYAADCSLSTLSFSDRQKLAEALARKLVSNLDSFRLHPQSTTKKTA